MDFIQFEAIDESQQNETINFSDDGKTDVDKNSIDDSEQPMEDVSFYRKFDPENIDHYNTFTNQTRDPKVAVKFDPENIDHIDTSEFTNQTRDPKVAVYKDDEMFFGTEDTQPELCDPEDRENVEFDKFDGFEKSVKKFKETLQNFKNSDSPFFDSIIFGLMFTITEGKLLEKKKANNVLEKDFYEGLVETKDDIQLDKTLFGFFKRCFLMNKVLAKHNFFFEIFREKGQAHFLD